MRVSVQDRFCVALSLFPLLVASSAIAQPLHDYAGLALAPAGDRIVTVDSADEPDAPSAAHGTIVVRSARDGHLLARIDPCAACTYSDPVFARDGRLVFVARDRKVGVSRLMLVNRREVQAIATVQGLVARPRWSPDGGSIAFLATVGARKEAGATQAGVRQIGEVGEADDEQRIAIVPAAGGVMRLVSPADRYIYEYDWTPDGTGFVATSASGNGDANWWVATLEAIDATTGKTRTITAP